jgi:hypothetical protein
LVCQAGTEHCPFNFALKHCLQFLFSGLSRLALRFHLAVQPVSI